MSIKAVIFDLDGTLIESEHLYALSRRKLLKEFGYDVSEDFIDWHVRNCSGMAMSPVLDKIEKVYGIMLKDKDAMVKRFREYRLDFFNENPATIKKGAMEIVDFLALNKIPMGMCSGSFMNDIEIKTRVAKFPIQHFKVTIGGDMVEYGRGKPHPDMYLLACEKLGVTPQSVLVIEDSDTGVESAHAAGCKVILVPDHEPSADTKKKAWHIVESLDKAIPIIQKELK